MLPDATGVDATSRQSICLQPVKHCLAGKDLTRVGARKPAGVENLAADAGGIALAERCATGAKDAPRADPGRWPRQRELPGWDGMTPNRPPVSVDAIETADVGVR